MTVNEDEWIGRCPRCGDDNPNKQVPIALGIPGCCAECEVNPWRDRDGYDRILYYQCMHCGQRYLTPKVDPLDVLLEATK